MAFNWAGGNILAFCEIDTYCQKVLRKHWPDVPIFTDVREINREVIRNAGISKTVDIVYGGFPCQPFSVAGNKKGKNDTRYLWPEFSRVVRDFRPRWVVGENVPGILSIAADTVCADLEREGYEVGIFDYEAASVGAKHRRERIFFVAHAGRALRQRISEAGDAGETDEKGNASATERPSSAHVADTNSKRLQNADEPGELRAQNGERTAIEPSQSGRVHAPNSSCPRCERVQSGRLSEAHTIFSGGGRREPEPELGRGFNGFPAGLDGISPIATGIPNRTNRLKALGNAVVPQQIYPIFWAIKQVGDENRTNMGYA